MSRPENSSQTSHNQASQEILVVAATLADELYFYGEDGKAVAPSQW